MMFDYQKHFEEYCKENRLELYLDFDMPSGYETANGTFDYKTKTVYINKKYLHDVSDCKKVFYLFHELRHAAQYLLPDNFSDIIERNLRYIIMYNGVCYKMVNEEYLKCKLDGEEKFFIELYAGQPYEVDANTFAYEQVKKIFGESEELQRLYALWLPHRQISDETYDMIFSAIDRKILSTNETEN